MPKNNIAALILAAGKSSRMGTLKQLLPLQETTLLEFTINNVKQANADKVFCVLGAQAKAIKPFIEKYDVEIIINSNYRDGLSSSIICGIEWIDKKKVFDAVLVALGDQPLIKPEYFNSLISSFSTYQNKIIATEYSNSFGVPVIVPRNIFSDLLQLKGDKGAKEFLNSQQQNIIGMKTDSLLDIDTMEDYRELINRIEKS